MPTNRIIPTIERRVVRRETFTTQGYRITPVARRTYVAWPGWSLVWERPAAVEVERDGHSRRLPIRDATRLAIVAVLAAGVVFRALGARWEHANKGKGSGRP